MAEPKRSSNKLFWLMIGLTVLSIGAAGAAAYLMWKTNNNVVVEEEEAGPVKRLPIFVDIAPFTVNITSSRGVSHLLYVGMTFKVSTTETRDVLEEHMPQVRSRLLISLSSQKADELTSIDGKTQLAATLIATLQEPPLADYQPELALEEVLFTEFIVQ